MSATGSCHQVFSFLAKGSLAWCQKLDAQNAIRGEEDHVVVLCVMLDVGVALSLTMVEGEGVRCHADVLIGSAVDNDEANGNLIRKLACHLNCLLSYPQSCRRSRPLSLAICDVTTEK